MKMASLAGIKPTYAVLETAALSLSYKPINKNIEQSPKGFEPSPAAPFAYLLERELFWQVTPGRNASQYTWTPPTFFSRRSLVFR